ncbi:MAG TPA: hypothetical protein VF456_28360 [Vicinamibacterales bacterium]
MAAANPVRPLAHSSPRRVALVRILFIIVAAMLFLQIPLRSRYNPWFPSILFPAGYGVTRTIDQYTAQEREFYAEDEAGRRYPVSLDELLPNVPSGYRGLEGAYGFGISQGRDVRRKTISIAGHPLTLTLGHDLTPAQIDETRTALRHRLAELGINAVRLDVLTYSVTIFTRFTPPRHRRELTESIALDLIGAAR